MAEIKMEMDPEKFVKIYFDKVIDENLKIYKDLYFDSKNPGSPDKISDKILKFTNSLSYKEKEALRLLIRQAMVDTSSNIFGIIDGTSEFETKEDRFKLFYKEENLLSGDLQPIFLEEDELRRANL